MTIQDVKQELGYSTLNLNTAMDKDNKPTSWMRHWDNDNRIAVSIHKDTVAAIKAGGVSTLSLQSETRTGEKGEYTAMRIVMHNPAEETL